MRVVEMMRAMALLMVLVLLDAMDIHGEGDMDEICAANDASHLRLPCMSIGHNPEKRAEKKGSLLQVDSRIHQHKSKKNGATASTIEDSGSETGLGNLQIKIAESSPSRNEGWTSSGSSARSQVKSVTGSEASSGENQREVNAINVEHLILLKSEQNFRRSHHSEEKQKLNIILQGGRDTASLINRAGSELVHETTNQSIDAGNYETNFATTKLISNAKDIEGTLIALDNRSIPAGSQLQVTGSDAYALGILAKIRSWRESISKGGSSTFTLAILSFIVLIIFILGILHYNRPHSQVEEKTNYVDPGVLHGASNAAYDSRASLRGTGAKSTPLQQQQVRPLLTPIRIPALHGPKSYHLCGGLVVPEGNECILAVPIISHSMDTEMQTTHVKDMQGKHIIQADVLPARGLRYNWGDRRVAILRAGIAPPPPQQSPILHSSMTTAAPSFSVLAHCQANFDRGSQKSVSICDSHEKEFARVQKEPPNKYIVTSDIAGLRYCFQGDFKNHSLTATDDSEMQQCLLADASPHLMHFDPNNTYFKLRVMAGVDVSLILLAIYSIDSMEFD